MTVKRALNGVFEGTTGDPPPSWLSAQIQESVVGSSPLAGNHEIIQNANFPNGAYQFTRSAGAISRYRVEIETDALDDAMNWEARMLCAVSNQFVHPWMGVRVDTDVSSGVYLHGLKATIVGLKATPESTRLYVGQRINGANAYWDQSDLDFVGMEIPDRKWHLAFRCRAWQLYSVSTNPNAYLQFKAWLDGDAEPEWRRQPGAVTNTNSIASSHPSWSLGAPFNTRGRAAFGFDTAVGGSHYMQVGHFIVQSFDFDTNVGSVGFGPGDP